MRKSLKNIKKDTDKLILQRQLNRDNENRVIVNMNISDDDSFLSEFSETETPVVSSNVAEFIEHSTLSIPVKEQLCLQIKSDCINNKEKVIYDKAIREYYREQYIVNEEEIKKNNLIATVLTVIGLLLLTLSIFLRYEIISMISSEVLNIVSWFFLWEAADISFLKTISLRKKRKRYLSFISMKIEYLSTKEK